MLDGIVFLPIFMGLVVWFWPGSSSSVCKLASFLALGHFLLSLSLFWFFDPTTEKLQLVSQWDWIPSLGISYFLGIDGLSFWFVLLTSFITLLVTFITSLNVHKHQRGFLTTIFVLQTTMLGSFLAMDSVLFYVFFEASLIPMYFLIGLWGGKRRIYATLKFFIFTMFGSVFMLLGVITLIILTGDQLGQYSASLLDFYKLNLPFMGGTIFSTQTLLFLSITLAFAVKIPLIPFHTWLPDAHVEAPTSGSVILAALMLKMGTYGLLRFVLPLFPDATQAFSDLFLFLAVLGIIYGALVALAQDDMKKLVAYSSVSHMGYIVLGIFAFNKISLTGSLYQMLNHGISTGALFFLVGMIYDKTHTRHIVSYGGLASKAPIFAIYFLIVTLSSIAVPMTNGFIGEFLILKGSFLDFPIFTGIALLGVVLGAYYMLLMFQRVFLGAQSPLLKAAQEKLDLKRKEIMVLLPLVILIFWMGIYPKHFLMWSEKSLHHLSQPGKYKLMIKGDKKVR